MRQKSNQKERKTTVNPIGLQSFASTAKGSSGDFFRRCAAQQD